MSRIETLSSEQEKRIPLIRQEWIDRASQPIDRVKAKAAIDALYAFNDKKSPDIAWVASPASACLLLALIKETKDPASLWASLRDSLGDSLGDSLWASLWASLRASLRASLGDSLWASLRDSLGDSLWASLRDSLWASLRDSLWDSLGDSLRDSLWDSLGASLRDSLRDSLGASLWASLGASLWASLRACVYTEGFSSWAAMFEFSQSIGVQFAEEKYDLYLQCCKELWWFFPFDRTVIICERPIVRWNDNDEIHSESSPAVEFKDGFKVWAVDGVVVPESVVLDPSSQSTEEIQSEENEEVRRIRISRYGWTNYLREIGGSVIDTQQAPGGWMEALIKTSDYAVLCTYDPSTGRPYALEVSQECDSCEEAQRYLFAPDIAFEGLGLLVPNTIETYPVIRT